MAEDNGMALGYALGQDSSGGGGGGFGGSFGEGLWAVIILAILFGRGGFGGFGGGMLGGGGGDCGCQAAISNGFALNGLENGIRGIQQGICDSTYALNNSIMSGFHGVDNAVCNLGYNIQQGFNTLGYQNQQCCCETQRLIERGFCDLGQSINMQTRDIIDNQNANYRGLMDFMVSEKLASKDARIAELTNQLSQSNQNAVIRAAIDASTAEIIRRTGNDCPVPSYLVQPPTPVNFPINGCGTVQFGNGYGGGCGCGCN